MTTPTIKLTPKRVMMHLAVYLVIGLMLNLPLIMALEISNVRAEEFTENSAVIKWNTDEPANSFLNYGLDKITLQRVGDAVPVTEHQLPLSSLASNNTYYYSVQSGEIIDNNNNEFYTFATLAPDTTAPSLNFELPEFIAGNRLNFNGTTEPGATLNLYINDIKIKTITAGETTAADAAAGSEIPAGSELTTFSFTDILVLDNIVNTIKVEAIDLAGNTAVSEDTVITDNHKPEINLGSFPEVTSESQIILNGTVSENSSIDLQLNNRSIQTFTGTIIQQEINLNEGKNIILIIAIDKAGWEERKEIFIESDTRPPRVSFELTNGKEYYEGRAETDLTGETEPGAKVYLYIYQPRVDDYRADFKHALQETTADSAGKFKFEDISFPPPAFTSLEDLAPREVPAGLEEIMIPQLENLGNEQRKTYHIYVIAEDKTGKTDYEQDTVNVNTCYSGNFAFDISLHPDFPPQPFRLDPQLIEEGRETIGAIFKIEYKGGIAPRTSVTGEVELPYDISLVDFEPACTRQMTETGDYKLGCQLLGRNLQEHGNSDDTIYYVISNLQSTEGFVDTEGDFWEEFNKRKLKIPIKAVIHYSERDQPDGSFGGRKTQAFCYDLGYFVDIPVESSEMVPDFLANEGVAALNWTIEAIEDIKPILETAMLVSGISCGLSMLVKFVAKLYRNFQAFLESILGSVEDDGCPSVAEQNQLFLDGTIDHWREIYGQPNVRIPSDYAERSLSEKCPATAGAWEFEALLDNLYKFTCDRFFCREVPAGWTAEAEYEDVSKIIQQQNSCTATSNCEYMVQVENCREELGRRVVNTDLITEREEAGEEFECYRYNNILYEMRNSLQIPELKDRGIYRLTLVDDRVAATAPELSPENMLAYRPEGSETFCAAEEISCERKCRRRNGYEAATTGVTIGTDWRSVEALTATGSVASTGGSAGLVSGATPQTAASGSVSGATSPLITPSSSGPCYPQDNITLREGQIAVGYTQDCFIDENSGEMYQCVCEPEDREEFNSGRLTSPDMPRIAAKAAEDFEEDWIYRQDKMFKENGGNAQTCTGGRAGTCYPSWRYYSGRDFTAAFGLNYGFDNFKSEMSEMSDTTVDPKETWGAFQTLCLPKINAHLTMLQSFLVGLRSCIIEAKTDALHDAGFCKAFFTQHVCGLIYRGLSSLLEDCSPSDYEDVAEEGEINEIEAGFDAFRQAVPATISSTQQELRDDYGAAATDFFAAGTGGMAQSLCLGFFGYDAPIFDTDFIMEAAYSVPIKSQIYFTTANRELVTFDPAQGTATYSYRLGGALMPGCKFRGYNVKLRCIGIEDLGNPGIDQSCDGQGCDCLQINPAEAQPFIGEREYPIPGGRSFGDITRFQMFDFPIESPLRISSNYRYDHVIVELFLDQGEDSEQCFDEEFRTSNGAKYYFPISHVGGPEQAQELIGGPTGCHVQTGSGRFVCPDIRALFEGGQTFIQPPSMLCYDKRNNEFVSCDTPNLFLLGDEIIIKPFINVGEEESCLKISDTRGIVEERLIPLSANYLGEYSRPESLGMVDNNMLSGGGMTSLRNTDDVRCELQLTGERPNREDVTTQSITFNYYPQDNNHYILNVPENVDIVSNEYSRDNENRLTLNNDNTLTLEEINAAEFSFSEFTFNLWLNNLGSSSGVCTFRTNQGRTSTPENTRPITIEMKLLQPGVGGDCYTTNTPLPSRDNNYRVTITIQERATEVALASDMHEDFMAEDYDEVMTRAEAVVNRREQTLEDAVAIYYWIASMIMDGNGIQQYQGQIRSLLGLFFNRRFLDEQLPPYPAGIPENGGVTGTGEYQRIHRYLCEVADQVYAIDNNYVVPSDCRRYEEAESGVDQQSTTTSLTCTTPTTNYQVIVTDTTGLNIRAGAGTNYEVVKNIPDNGLFEVCSNSPNGDWHVVKYSDSIGWANTNSRYAQRVNP